MLLASGCGNSDGHAPENDFPPTLSDETIESQAKHIVDRMSVREKLGQKIMMAFRYWCPDEQPGCTEGMTDLPDAATWALRDNAVGGVILFANNLTDLPQIARLTEQIQHARAPGMPLDTLIGIDEEGGNVFRLPRTLATTMPGNMALGAAYQGTHDESLALDSGRVLASEIRAAGFNANFAPDVDVNSNPLNPVINVRAYGDDPATVGRLGALTAQGMRSGGVVSTFKHFPGHGDTAVDSHFGLPVVDKSRADADRIDLAPYRQAIASGQAPDMIMTAHIQYPSLDDTRIATRSGESMIVPATMSRKIQHDLLRGEMGFRGVTVTDALDMKGISDFFDPIDTVLAVFQADVDIALMPVEIRTHAQVGRLRALVDRLAAAVESGELDRAALDESVTRIVRMKLRNGNASFMQGRSPPTLETIGSPQHRAVEERIARQSITLLRNRDRALPLRGPQQRIYIVTPWGEQAEAMRRRFAALGYIHAAGAKLGDTPWEAQRQSIDASDVVIVGTLSTGFTPIERNGDPNLSSLTAPQKRHAYMAPRPAAGVRGSLVFNVGEDTPPASSKFALRAMSTPSEAEQLHRAMAYAKQQGKTVIHVALRAPYDVLDHEDVADASLATYAYYGYENGLRGPSLPILVDVLTGLARPVGRLPVDIRSPDPDGAPGPVRYARGFGLSF